MSAILSHTSINCSNAFELSEWWKQVLGYVDVDGDPNEPGDEECMIRDPDGDQRLLFIEVEDLQDVPGRIHFDICSGGSTRDEEIERILNLGAAPIADRRNPDGSGWMTLADPAGNHFCVVRSDAERQPAS
jgi:catechol 2,3-dioxygenase-like lactoylglutathione lyase family enzyme